MMFAFGVDELTTTTNDVVGGVIVLLFVFGPAATAFTYCTTFIFSSPAYCNSLNIIFGFLIGASRTGDSPYEVVKWAPLTPLP